MKNVSPPILLRSDAAQTFGTLAFMNEAIYNATTLKAYRRFNWMFQILSLPTRQTWFG